VTYGNGLFVAVGDRRHHPHLPGRGELDGADLGDEQPAQGVTYGNGTFVAVGEGGTILTSPDGVTWTQRTSGTATPLRRDLRQRHLRGGGGNGGTILTSPDGVNWTARTSGTSNWPSTA
jgi:hypothetical protein